MFQHKTKPKIEEKNQNTFDIYDEFRVSHRITKVKRIQRVQLEIIYYQFGVETSSI